MRVWDQVYIYGWRQDRVVVCMEDRVWDCVWEQITEVMKHA